MTSIQVISLAAGCIALSFFISFGVSPLAILISKKTGALDIPGDDRRMHKHPVPRLGGIAIFVSFAICLLILWALLSADIIVDVDADEMTEKIRAILIAGTLIFILGLVDDFKNIKARYKFIGQIVCAALAFVLGVRIPAIALFGWQFSDDSAGGIFVSFIITVIWLVAITNMINLIDGLDGLAAGVTGIAALAIAYTAYLNGYYTAALAMAILAGAALGFLPFNFYPAKIFMGDSGAMFLGFAIAAVSIISPAKSATLVAIIAPVLVLGVPAFDIVFAIFRRRRGGKPVFEADKGHLHHQLSRIGIGQRRSTLMFYGISGIMGIAAITLSRDHYFEAISLFLITVLFIIVLIWGWDKKGK